MRSASQHVFSISPKANIQRSQFDRSHSHKTTFSAGYLIPVYVDEVLPGDTFNLNMTAFARLNTPISPIMDNIWLDSFFFFVPNRLVWSNWEYFMGAKNNPDDDQDYLIPQIVAPAPGFSENTLFDYFGVPTKVAYLEINGLFARAYNLIWNTWFRDQNLQDSVVVDLDDGPDGVSDYVLLKRGKRHDYFTSALPWPQKGEDTLIPISGTIPVVTDSDEHTTGAADNLVMRLAADGSKPGSTVFSAVQGTTGIFGVTGSAATITGGAYPSNLYANIDHVNADLTGTINDLRTAFQIQKLLERDARGGTRYIEIIKAHFGVTSPDFRLQRPEYLGGGKSRVNINPVAQTSSTDVTTPQGNLAAFGTASIDRHGFTKSFTEHGMIIGLVSARADLHYQQGIPKMWLRETKYDFYWPAFANLGEQAILNKEIYAQDWPNAQNDEVFGYQERWAEYRYKPSQVTGLMRSNATGSLDLWHLAQEFGSLPVLDSDFIEENPPMDRVMAVPDEPDFIFDSYFSIKCARPMPVYSIPGLVDHF